MDNFFNEIVPKLKKEFISKIDINDLIKYELINHECYYTGDYTEVEEIINSYCNLSKDEIHEKVKDIYLNNKNIDDFDNGHIGI